MNTKELIDKLERIEMLALSIKNRHAANAIAVHAQELIRGLHQSYKVGRLDLAQGEWDGGGFRYPEPHNMDEDGVGCKPQDTDR